MQSFPEFFGDMDKVIKEVKRVLRSPGTMICSVPVPERKKNESIIRGNLHSENELKEMFEGEGFDFVSYDLRNGALLYFKASLK